jgi:hypothetical protein
MDTSEILTISEIHDRFQSEWVLLADPKTTAALEVVSGTVLWHSKDRDEVYRKALEFRPKHSAVLYTGKIEEDSVVAI